MGWLTRKPVVGRRVLLPTVLWSMWHCAADAFNCSKSSPQWEEVYSRMCNEYYQSGGLWLFGPLHSHFVDLYSSFKLGVRHLSVQVKEKKFPVVYTKGDDCCEEYVDALNNLLGLDAKKYNSKKWWSAGVVEMLLPMHIALGNKIPHIVVVFPILPPFLALLYGVLAIVPTCYMG